MDSFYSGITESKNSQKIPLYKSGRAAHSKYAPDREAENFGREATDAKFALVLGLAGGYHIQSYLMRNPGCRILVVERFGNDISFLQETISCAGELKKDRRITFCTAPDAGRELAKNYFPAYYGNLSILTLRSWADEDKTFYENCVENIKDSLKKISADYSVQAHFGRLWEKNIFSNLHILHKIECGPQKKQIHIDCGKTAAVIAAGPTLDETVKIIESERDRYYVIAADTAFKALCRRGIRADAAVSIDAQHLSAMHFCAPFFNDTLFVLDLSGNHSITRFLYDKGANIIFSDSGHPLIKYASSFCKKSFPALESGGGTVTIAAASFAKECGFKKIEIFGADFGYSKGKSYTRGTYLDDLYYSQEKKTESAEVPFTRLMFRTPLKRNGRGFLENDLLLNYRTTMEEWLDRNCADWKYSDNIYRGILHKKEESADLLPNGFRTEDFRQALKNALQRIEKTDGCIAETSLILPSMAYYSGRTGQNKNSTNEAKKLALNKIMLYNNLL